MTTARCAGFFLTERRRSRTYPAWGCHASPVLKTVRKMPICRDFLYGAPVDAPPSSCRARGIATRWCGSSWAARDPGFGRACLSRTARCLSRRRGNGPVWNFHRFQSDGERPSAGDQQAYMSDGVMPCDLSTRTTSCGVRGWAGSRFTRGGDTRHHGLRHSQTTTAERTEGVERSGSRSGSCSMPHPPNSAVLLGPLPSPPRGGSHLVRQSQDGATGAPRRVLVGSSDAYWRAPV